MNTPSTLRRHRKRRYRTDGAILRRIRKELRALVSHLYERRIVAGPVSRVLSLASTVVWATSAMPAIGSTRTTGSPAAGLPVVLLVTVPVTGAACANAPAKSEQEIAECRKVLIDLIVLKGILIFIVSAPGSSLLQVFNLGQQLCSFVFKLRTLRQKILFRIFSGAVFEVQVAQIFVELFLALLEIVEPCLLPLACEDVLGPECVDQQRLPPSPIRLPNPASHS